MQAIAVGYLGASLILLLKEVKWQIVVTSGLLILYWGLMNFTPGFDLSVEGNLAIYIDKMVYESHMGNPEYPWILAGMTFTVTVMLGVFAGQILTSLNVSKLDKLKKIALFGVLLTIAGYILTLHEPCIKKLWSSSFTLISGGYCVLLLSLFYLIIDVAGYKKWATPFVVLGKNALLVYMLFAYNRFINLGAIADKLLFGFKTYLNQWYPLAVSCMALILLWVIFRYLDRKKNIFEDIREICKTRKWIIGEFERLNCSNSR